MSVSENVQIPTSTNVVVSADPNLENNLTKPQLQNEITPTGTVTPNPQPINNQTTPTNSQDPTTVQPNQPVLNPETITPVVQQNSQGESPQNSQPAPSSQPQQSTEALNSNVIQIKAVEPPPAHHDIKLGDLSKGFAELSLIMSAPETIETAKVKNWSEAEKFGHKRVDALKNLNQDFYAKENEFVHRERRFLDKSEGFLYAFNSEVLAKIGENQKLIAQLELEAQNLEPKRAEGQAGLDKIQSYIDDLEHKIAEDRNEILQVIKNREILAGKINPEELKKIKIKNEKSLTNLIFQWVIVVIYGENLSKYNWSNFKEQVFKKDSGQDFTDRLRGFNVHKNKVDLAITKKVVEDKVDILAEAEKGSHQNNSLRALFDYAALIKKVSEDLEEIKSTEVLLNEKKQELEKKKNVHSEVLNHILGIEGQLKILKTYNSAFVQIQEITKNSINLVEKRSANQQAYLQKYGGKEPEDQFLEVQKEEEEEEKRIAAQAPTEGQGTSVEDGFGPAAKSSPKKSPKKAVRGGVTDLGETPFAEKKTGGCEGCNIF